MLGPVAPTVRRHARQGQKEDTPVVPVAVQVGPTTGGLKVVGGGSSAQGAGPSVRVVHFIQAPQRVAASLRFQLMAAYCPRSMAWPG